MFDNGHSLCIHVTHFPNRNCFVLVKFHFHTVSRFSFRCPHQLSDWPTDWLWLLTRIDRTVRRIVTLSDESQQKRNRRNRKFGNSRKVWSTSRQCNALFLQFSAVCLQRQWRWSDKFSPSRPAPQPAPNQLPGNQPPLKLITQLRQSLISQFQNQSSSYCLTVHYCFYHLDTQ